LGQEEAGVQTRGTIAEASSYLALLSSTEPQNVKETCKDECRVKAMDEELEQIEKILPMAGCSFCSSLWWITRNLPSIICLLLM